MKNKFFTVSMLVIIVNCGAQAQGLDLPKKKTIELNFSSEIDSSYVEALQSADKVQESLSQMDITSKEGGFDTMKVKTAQRQVLIRDIQAEKSEEGEFSERRARKKSVKLKVKVKKHDIENTFNQAIDHEISSLELGQLDGEELAN